MSFFRLYQYVVPLVIFPLCYWAWWTRYDHDHRLTLYALALPILFSYVVPALGTNWLKIWEFNTRWKLGRFRPQHGFLFGTVTSLFGLLCLGYPPRALDGLEMVRAGFIMGSVLAFWNWLYDLHAIRVGFLRVYNRAYAENRGPEAIATEYCPVFFGTFGFCYGIAIRMGESYLADQGRFDLYWLLLSSSLAMVILCPVSAYVIVSLVSTGQTGLRSYENGSADESNLPVVPAMTFASMPCQAPTEPSAAAVGSKAVDS